MDVKEVMQKAAFDDIDKYLKASDIVKLLQNEQMRAAEKGRRNRRSDGFAKKGKAMAVIASDFTESAAKWSLDKIMQEIATKMKHGIYHIENDKIYKMSLDEPMKQIGIVTSNETIMNIIDTVTEYMYCNWGDCCMKEEMTWDKLQKVRDEIKNNAMKMINGNLDMKR